jgi:hypothetical protein
VLAETGDTVMALSSKVRSGGRAVFASLSNRKHPNYTPFLTLRQWKSQEQKPKKALLSHKQPNDSRLKTHLGRNSLAFKKHPRKVQKILKFSSNLLA